MMKAAEQGLAAAQNGGAFANATGAGVATVDVVEAYKWYLLAFAQNDPNAKVNLEVLSPRLSLQQMEEGRRRASEFKPKIAVGKVDQFRP
jgi:TPR repeat protein